MKQLSKWLLVAVAVLNITGCVFVMNNNWGSGIETTRTMAGDASFDLEAKTESEIKRR